MNRTLSIVLASLLLAPFAIADEPSIIEDSNFGVEEGWLGDDTAVGYTMWTLPGSEGGIHAFELTQSITVPSARGQFSYTIPAYQDRGAGLGDATIDYRFRALQRESIAIAPRVSLVLPTRSLRFGARSTGVQTVVPLSLKLGSRLTSHTNLGATWFHTRGQAEFTAAQAFAFSATDGLSFTLETNYTRCPDGHLLVTRPGVSYAFDVAGVTVSPGVAFPMTAEETRVMVTVGVGVGR